MKPPRQRVLRMLIGLLILVVPGSAAAQLRYVLDPSATKIHFEAYLLGLAPVIGEFTRFTGALAFCRLHPERSQMNVTLDASEIHTAAGTYDRTLQGPDFFDAVHFPQITFRSTSLTMTLPWRADVEGWLTMHGITRPIVLYLQDDLNAVPGRAADQGLVRFSVRAIVVRSLFGIDRLRPLIGDEVRLLVDGVAMPRVAEGKSECEPRQN